MSNAAGAERAGHRHRSLTLIMSGLGSCLALLSATSPLAAQESVYRSDAPAALSVQCAPQSADLALEAANGTATGLAGSAVAMGEEPYTPAFGTISTTLSGQPAPAPSANVGGFSLVAHGLGPQLALMSSAGMFAVSVRADEEVGVTLPLAGPTRALRILVDVQVRGGGDASVSLTAGDRTMQRTLQEGTAIELSLEVPSSSDPLALVATTRGLHDETGVRWQHWRYLLDDKEYAIPLNVAPSPDVYPPPPLPDPRRDIERELIEWDWRLQDGIGTAREPRSWAQAIEQLLQRGDLLIENLQGASVSLDDFLDKWEQLRSQTAELAHASDAQESQWEALWRHAHELRRELTLRNPLAETGPLVFAKQVPSCFSHQLTQYYGMCARPGGGIFVLDAPGRSMHTRQLTDLPAGSCQHPEVSWDGRHILFAYCEAPTVPPDRAAHQERTYHIYQVASDGSDLRQLTDGPYDDFSPRYLPDGKLVFLSTRRGGFHRCGGGPCPVYTLAAAEADGSNPHPISYHETHEWDPVVLNDGRLLYTRWDYVDRHAVHYQQLWTVRQDGSNVAAFYGNNTFNPVGVWEARPIPNSDLVMATAAAHHAMTAGSIILLDVSQGIDGLDPISRLTPDVLFPESEFPVQHWHAPAGVPVRPEVPTDERRWPGHCYRSPYPLSTDFFLAAYSYDALLGEPSANKANMFGLYLVDRFGNRELLYRDLNIASLWPTPLRPRMRPPVLSSALDQSQTAEGTYFLQNVYDSWPHLPSGEDNSITHLRIIQVLLKTTPNANSPRVGFANASPGKQVLGTVPVEPDGSAYFRVPARTPLAFQALDRNGMAVQTMRSLTYLQPGEHTSCIGCHEHRSSAPASQPLALARQRTPSSITPGPDGSKPLSYPLLVQPVLDRLCVECHRGPEAEGGVALTGEPAGEFTVSYNALTPLVSYSEWKGTPADNSEPLTRPDLFGARASKLMQLLLKGHEDVVLSEDDWDRLVTWMDANALFYGSFDPADQQRQQRGERIAGPALE
ncbi:MAG: HzsA-related protein [Pirellulaceae bacterium]